MKNISSLTHSFVKEIVKLRDNASFRKTTGLCIVEGHRALATFIEAGIVIEKVVFSDSYKQEVPTFSYQVEKYLVSDEVMKKISSQVTPAGIVALAKIPKAKTQLTDGILLDNLQDPGNAGTLIRTAAACNQTTIFKFRGVDLWSPKVVQASAGAVALCSIHEVSLEELKNFATKKRFIALVPRDGQAIDTADLTNSILVIGNEGQGISKEILDVCTLQTTLVMPGKTESLNAAAAGSIAIYTKYLLTRLRK